MAVQAHHHPSTLFFLNRNVEEGNDYSNQPHKLQRQSPSINAGVDTRKRAREVIDLETTVAPMKPPPQVNGRRQVPNVVSTGLRLSNRESSFPMLTGDLAGEIKRQTDELDRFLEIQVTTFIRRHAELESRAAQIETESRAWQMRAAAREAEATSLQARLQQAVVVAHGGGVTTAEQKSGSVEGFDEAEDAESVYVDPERNEMIGPGCKFCRRRSATVLALPCRHLVLCRECDGAVRVCPLCLCLKSSSVEVFFS